MKKETKRIYKVLANCKEIECLTLDEAIEKKNFLENCFGIKGKISEFQKDFYEIEIGDHIRWIDKPQLSKATEYIDRIDVVTDIFKNMFGDVQYKTKELNGKRIGQAYKSQIELVID